MQRNLRASTTRVAFRRRIAKQDQRRRFDDVLCQLSVERSVARYRNTVSPSCR